MVEHDKNVKYDLAPLNGETASQRLPLALRGGDPGSLVLLEPNRTLLRSEAILAILTSLGGLWRALSLLRLIPKFIRDPLYNLIAQNRRRLSTTLCKPLSPEQRLRFLP